MCFFKLTSELIDFTHVALVHQTVFELASE